MLTLVLCYDGLMKRQFRILRPINLRPRPDKYEERVAEICAEWFQSDIEFVARGNINTPDIKIVRIRQYWEIKNIRGVGKHTVEDNLRKASKQSANVIISLLRASNINECRVESRIRDVLSTRRMPIKHIILITKAGKVIDIK